MIKLGTISAPRRTKGATGAFTLVEVLVAAAIGAIIFAALFAGISNSFSLINTSRSNLRATQIMVSRLEGVRLCAWGNGTNLATQLFNPAIVPTNFTDYYYPQGLNGTSTNSGTVYNGTISIMTNITLSPSASYASNMALVTVSVTWSEGISGLIKNHTRSMSTYVSQYGMQTYVYSH